MTSTSPQSGPQLPNVSIVDGPSPAGSVRTQSHDNALGALGGRTGEGTVVINRFSLYDYIGTSADRRAPFIEFAQSERVRLMGALKPTPPGNFRNAPRIQDFEKLDEALDNLRHDSNYLAILDGMMDNWTASERPNNQPLEDSLSE